jgi:hypothetical protein
VECDRLIQKQKKKLQIPAPHPSDWYQLVHSVEKTRKFRVTELTFQDFTSFSFPHTKPLFFIKLNEGDEPFHWRDKNYFINPRTTGKAPV